MPDLWPLRHLVLRTPRLTLRPDDDEGLSELAVLALRGVHPPREMPFLSPWTDQAPEDLVRGTLQFHWGRRSRLTPLDWNVDFLVRHDDRVIGEQSLSAKDFAITREVSTGSWLGTAHQRRGFGTEMRAAALLLAFDHLGATAVRSGAFTDNPASLRTSEKLGYRRDGTNTRARRGTVATEIRLVLQPEHLVRPEWRLQVDGLESCRELLGAV
ncbi:MAG: GNAT family N-acetyltransferase [Pseudonocardiales bacterium]|nr:GNAT family N-acetyltransferase [Pseudonocardiales bacterium]MBV9031704.1 GNAT family N-acetyltransferase [Pseudonocardiales bacterium]MBW0011299.1 GNAT family N-acetyltransferase [Pseudonocardiales bacterium]